MFPGVFGERSGSEEVPGGSGSLGAADLRSAECLSPSICLSLSVNVPRLSAAFPVMSSTLYSARVCVRVFCFPSNELLLL